MNYKSFFVVVITIIIGSTQFSCGSMKTSIEQYTAIDKEVYFGNWDKAISLMQNEKDNTFGEKDRVLYWIDFALLNYYAKNDSIALEFFSKAEEAIDELYTKSVSKAAVSMLLNDNALEYFGEDYENIYISLFKALIYYKNDNINDAEVEIRRLNEKLSLLETKNMEMADNLNSSQNKVENFRINKNTFYSSALARYLSMLIYLSQKNTDDANIEKEKINEAFITESALYNFSRPDLDIYFKNSKKIKLNFLVMVGKSPIKYALNMKINSYKNEIKLYTSQKNNWHFYETKRWQGISSGFNIKFSLPKIQKRGTNVEKVEVLVNGNVKTILSPIESIENISVATYKIKEPIIYLKAITRSILKAIANEAANKELDKKTGGGIWGSLTRALTSKIMGTTENADLRITHYFPSLALIGLIELDEGNYNIKINYIDKYNDIIATQFFDNYKVNNFKSNHLIDSYCLK